MYPFLHLVVLSLQIILNRLFHLRLILSVFKIQVTSFTGGVWILNGIANLMPMICVSQDVLHEHSDYTKNLLLLLFLSLNSTAVPGRTHVILAHSLSWLEYFKKIGWWWWITVHNDDIFFLLACANLLRRREKIRWWKTTRSDKGNGWCIQHIKNWHVVIYWNDMQYLIWLTCSFIRTCNLDGS